jgi:hypothetical protein
MRLIDTLGRRRSLRTLLAVIEAEKADGNKDRYVLDGAKCDLVGRADFGANPPRIRCHLLDYLTTFLFCCRRTGRARRSSPMGSGRFCSHARQPWNKGRIVSQKRPLKPKEVWTIPARLQLEQRKRDLAMFNLAIDSKLRACDLIRIGLDDVCIGGRVRTARLCSRRRLAGRSNSKLLTRLG